MGAALGRLPEPEQPHGDGDGDKDDGARLGPARWRGWGGLGWLAPSSQRGWEASQPWREGEAGLRGPLTPLLSLQGSRGPKGYKVSVAWARTLPGAAARLRSDPRSLHLAGREGQARCGRHGRHEGERPGSWGQGTRSGDSGPSQVPQTWRTGASCGPQAAWPSSERLPGRDVSRTRLPFQGETGYPGLPGCKGSPGFDVSCLCHPYAETVSSQV